MKQLLLFLFTLSVACYGCKEKNKTIHLTTSPDFDKGESLVYLKQDSAFYYFNKVVNSSTDSLQIAMAYNYMAFIQLRAGDYFGSQESLMESFKHLNEKRRNDYSCLSSDYNILGNNCLNLKNYNAAIGYYDQALQFEMDSSYKLIYLNNKALAYQKTMEYSRSIAIYDSIIDQFLSDKKEYARTLSNMTKTKWLQDPSYTALPKFRTALEIRKNINDNLGLNASYAHLSDYYSHSWPDSALFYAATMYKNAQQINSPDDELEALQKLIKLGPANDLKQYFARFEFLNDSLQTARNAAKNQFALIRYEAEKSKSENLELQKDNTEKRLQIIQQRILFYGTLFLFLSIAIISIIWYRKRKQRMILETQNAIHEHQLKISKKVHDVVANGLYRIMAKLEHKDSIEKEPLMDEMEILYEKSRDISYEQPTVLFKDFEEEIACLIKSFATPTTKIAIAGNDRHLWDKAKPNTKKELLYVLQELMINMKKHSQAQHVVTKFEQQGDQIIIQYTDDGVGLPPSFQYGNGLTNTGNRIKEIGGQIIFDDTIEKGLKVRISFPTR